VDVFLDLTRDRSRFGTYTGLVRDGGFAISTTNTASPELLGSDRITVTNYMMQDKPGLLARITEEVVSGRITVPIERTITMDQVPAALARYAVGGARGKTVVRIRESEG
jgi:NADPH:quinone reductase-like Zn-dependent oxidoreductase